MSVVAAPTLSQWYAGALGVCQQWAPCNATTPLQEVLKHFPAAQALPPLNPEELAPVVSSITQQRFNNKCNVQEFRNGLQQYLVTAAPASPLNIQTAEPWHVKDVFHLLCELLLFTDLSGLQREIVAVMAQAVIIFGRDASTLVGFLLCMRMSGWGRAAHTEETNWLVSAAVKTIQGSEAYLVSEFFGSLSLAQILDRLG